MNYVFNSTGYPMYLKDINRCSGCYVFDTTNKKFLDFESGVWALPLGHNHLRIKKALIEQLSIAQHVGYKYNHYIVETTAKKLIDISKIGESKCVFLCSGSEAVEYAIRIAKVIKKGKKCLSLQGQYLSAYGFASVPTNDDWVRLPFEQIDCKTIQEWKEYVSETVTMEEIGVFVFEAGNTSGLVKLPPKNLITAIQHKIQEVSGILIANEVTCGMGRTGKWFGYMHYDLLPDIIATGKGLGNGYPISAVIINDEIVKLLDSLEFRFAQSHQNDPLGCKIALQVIQTIEEEQLLKKANMLSLYFQEKFEKLMEIYPIIKELRILGLLICIQLDHSIRPEKMLELDKRIFDLGVIIGTKPLDCCIRIYMPLISEKHMIDDFILIFEQCISNMCLI